MRGKQSKTAAWMVWLAASAGAFLHPGCVSPGDDGPSYKYPDKSSYCDGRARAECNDEVVAACAASDADKCIADRNAACVAAIPTNSTYQPAAADACIAAVSQAFADAKLKIDEMKAYNDACLVVFDGMSGAGQSCGTDSDCQVSTGLRCLLAPASTSGTCQIPVPVAGGEKCDAPAAKCMDGFHCGASMHCDADGAGGDTCSATAPCGTGLSCSGAMQCMPKKSDGATCTQDTDCMNQLCDKGSSPASGVCTSQIIFSTMEAFCVGIR